MSSSSQPTLLLYSTIGCHLCEQAEVLVRQWLNTAAIRWVDIADDADLLAQYGTRIPVLCRMDTGQELDWPFDGEKIIRWLTEERL